ncbi:hypothetical protein Tco_0653271 [Tanacetum coccineum]|uniref:Uncharacterized protein n=1 Tax=Tanacetum coccineum TaxID=301880 RepID=A0ABQ4WZW8_9ASTR
MRFLASSKHSAKHIDKLGFPSPTTNVSDPSDLDFTYDNSVPIIDHSNFLNLAKNSIEHAVHVIMEYLVKISKKARILELKRRHLKITFLTSNTPYPSRKIRCICACTSLKTTKEQDPIHRIVQKINTMYLDPLNTAYWSSDTVTELVVHDKEFN